MGVDYYKILQVDRNAKYDDLKKAYKEAEAQFKQISEAYGVLSDPQKRAVYDRYGEEGPQGHMPRSDAGGPGGGATYFSTGKGPTTFHSNPRSRDDVFQEFFGFTSPYDDPQSPHAGRQSSGSTCFSPGNEPTTFHSNPRRPDDIFQEFFGCSSPFGSSGGGSRKAPPIENSLPCSLEELYKGTTKKMKITRDIVHRSGKIMQVEEVLTIDVKRGWKKGTKITFPEKGNEKPNVMPADVVFIIDEKPHRVFTRDGNDLIVTKNISLAEAIAGYTVHLTTLDGRNLIIPIDTIIHPNFEEIAPREGMPLPKDPSKKGNLRIKFNIFPTRLTVEQKAGIKKLLGA